MKPLDPQARELIDEVNASDTPPCNLEAQLWRDLSPRLNEALPPTAAAASQALTARGGLAAASPLLKLWVGAALVGACVVGAVMYRDREASETTAQPSVTPQQPASHSAAPPAHARAVNTAAPLPEARAPEYPAAVPQVNQPDRAGSPDANEARSGRLLAETHLLARAQRALRGHDPQSALALIERHAARFPNGALAQERDAARVFALCALTRVADAAKAQQRFLQTWSDSPLTTRVRNACQARGD